MNGEGQIVNEQNKKYATEYYMERWVLNFTTLKLPLPLKLAVDLMFYDEMMGVG